MTEFLQHLTSLVPDLADLLVYGAIALVSIIGFFKCLVPLWNTTHALRRAVRLLQDSAGSKREIPVWQEARFMGRRLKGSWQRFLLNAEQLDRRGLPCNVEDYINDDTVTHGPGNAQLAELVPSLLTSLGILGTFIGMTRGLGALDISNNQALVESIPTLLGGMQSAFLTSVAGVSCSLVFNMLNRIAVGSSYRAIDDFSDCFTQLAMQRPLDNDVQMICQNQDRNALITNATEGMGNQMAGCIELAVTRAMQPVCQTMDNFLVGATRAQVEGVGRIATQFVDQMNRALGDSFLQLGQTITSINQHQQLTFDRVEKSLQSACTIVADANRLHGVSEEVMSRFESYVKEMTGARRRDEQFEQKTAEVLERMHEAADAQAHYIAQLRTYQTDLAQSLGQCTRSSADAVAAMKGQTTELARELTDSAASMQASSQQLSASYTSFVQNVVEGLSRSLGLFDKSMHEVIDALGDRVDAMDKRGTDGETVRQLSQIQQMLTGMGESLQRTADALSAKGA